jgi:maleate isomerase
MPDSLGWRMKMGVITPSTNTVVQPELEAMRPPGVTNHIFRLALTNPSMGTPADFERMVQQVDAGLDQSVAQAMTCEPDHLILACSIESIWGTGKGGPSVGERIRQRAGDGIKVTQAPEAMKGALDAFGVKGKVSVLTPYQPTADVFTRAMVEGAGYQVGKIKNLGLGRSNTIAKIDFDEVRKALREIDGDDIGAFIQLGAALPMMHVATEAEKWLGKPVIALNTALYWHALRTNGIDDKVYDCGRLLSEH